MSKSILIIDMPKRCLDCPLCYTEELFTYRCTVSEDQVEAEERYCKCPLKPMLSREDIYEEMYLAYGLWKEEYYERMRDAVDKVLDEILGEQE